MNQSADEEILVHYSEKPLTQRIINREQKSIPDLKPQGFWVSVDSSEDNWPAWCRREGFAVETLAVSTRVFLRADARILRLTTVAEIDAFASKFRSPALRGFGSGMIEWARVATEHQGIIISPYQYDRRLAPGFLWYYGWDCASGCIWDLRTVADLVELRRST